MGRVACLALLMQGACFLKPDPPGGTQPPQGSTGHLVAGLRHACTIDTSGALFCWGDNRKGQLGVATTTRYSATPVKIDGTWKQVAAGDAHTCAIDDQDAVWCWGQSDLGEAGMVGATLGRTQVALPDSSSIATRLYAGGDASCVTDQFGLLFCWGDYDPADSGPHGPDRLHPGSASAAHDDWRDVAMGSGHLCARNDFTEVWCWGLNSDIQVGDPTGDPHTVDNAFHVANTTFLSIAAGQYASCGITTDHEVACWGAPQVTGTVDTSPYIVIGSDKDWTTVAVGGSHACAVHQNDDLDCWGVNDHGQLGNDYTPKGAPGATTLANVSAVAAGDVFTCAIVDGAIRCWGSDQHGESGRGTSATTHVPFMVFLPEAALSVATGLAHSCAALASGKVYCWGKNLNGQADPNGTFAVTTPTDTTHVVDITATDSRLLSLGYAHTCSLASRTQLDCWGDDSDEQLGPSTMGVAISDATFGTGTKFVDFAAGGFASCASTDANELYCWGSFEATQHGPQATDTASIVALTYNHGLSAAPAGMTNAVDEIGVATFCQGATGTLVGDSGTALQRQVYLAQGGAHGCALDNDGIMTTTLVCWGDNGNHQVSPNPATCIAPPTVWSTPGSAKVAIPNGVMWAQNKTRPQTVAVGGDHTCAIQEAPNNAGALYCWGANFESELGDLNDASDVVTAPHVATAGNWVEIATGQFHTCALNDASEVWCWGLNQWGEVGNGDRFQSNARTAAAIQF